MSSDLDAHLAAYTDDFAYAFDNAIILNWYPTRIIEDNPANLRVLELGVGHGYTSNRFAEHFTQYEVIDGSEKVINLFRENYPDAHVTLHEGYFETFEPDGKYDLIVMGFVLEHVADPALVLKRYGRFLREGGKVVVAVPNAESLHRRFGHAAGMLPDMMEIGAGDRALGHQRLFTVPSLNDLLVDCGYRITKQEGIFLKPFTTGQLKQLDLPSHILDAMCVVGRDYPELSTALLFEAQVA